MGNIITSTTLKSENPVAHRCQHPLPLECFISSAFCKHSLSLLASPARISRQRQTRRPRLYFFFSAKCLHQRQQQQEEEEAAAGGGSSSSSRRQQQQQEAAAAGGSSSSRRKQQQQQEAAAAAGGSSSSRRKLQPQQQQEAAATAAGGSSNSSSNSSSSNSSSSRRQQQGAASKQQASRKQAESSNQRLPRWKNNEIQYKFYKSTQYKNWIFSRRTAPKQWNRPITKSCGDAKLELFPREKRPPDTTSTRWYDLTLGLVGSNRIMSTKHCAQRWKSVRINNPSNKELSKSIRNTARTQVWYDFRSIDTT